MKREIDGDIEVVWAALCHMVTASVHSLLPSPDVIAHYEAARRRIGLSVAPPADWLQYLNDTRELPSPAKLRAEASVDAMPPGSVRARPYAAHASACGRTAMKLPKDTSFDK
jgi:hypothetical protein